METGRDPILIFHYVLYIHKRFDVFILLSNCHDAMHIIIPFFFFVFESHFCMHVQRPNRNRKKTDDLNSSRSG